MKIAIVGGGWAGLSAAVTAVGLGHHVCVFESGAVLGGRARSVHVPALEATVDNGQHILLGAYTATLALIHTLGLDPARQFKRLPLSLLSLDSSLRMRAAPGLPAPLNIAAGLLSARGLGWKDKLAATRAISQLKRNGWKTPRAATVQEWLSLSLQPARLRHLLWAPLCVATLNTPVERACAQLFANVLRDSLGSDRRDASDMLIPRTTLTELWPAKVQELALTNAWSSLEYSRICSPDDESAYAKHRRVHTNNGFARNGGSGVGRLDVRYSSTVRRLHYLNTSGIAALTPLLALDDAAEHYDTVLVCGNTPSTARLLATLPAVPGSQALLDALHAFEHAPIATLTIELARPWRLPAPMLLLHEDRRRAHFGQWLFQGQDAGQRYLHIVISDAGALLRCERELAVAGVIEQITEQSGGAMPPVLQHALIVEKRATFQAVPDLKRPPNRTPWPGVWIAGDWTATGYPAVLEGAVRSGRDAVLDMHAAFCESQLGLMPDTAGSKTQAGRINAQPSSKQTTKQARCRISTRRHIGAAHQHGDGFP